ncbi:MerR family transcriptional regulator [Saccharopolyspora dendranthemae]|uniref:DNA-binding transcriptional MerR regulator n=1 Tax=Saccharopolyspora dendranthemae TaxID=1181886 RepID=A0A561V9Z9_9PSEU|nr:MerR family transcriptional regulator [Saccharopolyspora dendranthemae]TWG08451.1 DNA-binding transcriptional MerR regulator [Saccharopolyspora dendranthemae]
MALSTAAVAAASCYSLQQVRDLEGRGVIPEADRADNGYRRFSEAHVRALRAYRDLAHAVGPVEARRAMREIRRCAPEIGVALISSLHAGLNQERGQAMAARRALEAIEAEERVDAEPVEADSMTITELSQALGVKSSALRFWEGEALVAPDRVATRVGTARRYGLVAIREARITAALRAGGYRVPEVREAIGAIRELRDVSGSLAALDARLLAIGQRGLALLRAGALLAELIET